MTTSTFAITSTASDIESGVQKVELWYKKDTGSWTKYGEDTASPWSWNFDTTSTSGDGTYQFYSRAWDNANNYEDAPVTNDTWTIVDTTKPTSSIDALSTYMTTGTFTITATTSDTSGISKVELWYKKDIGSWTKYEEDTASPWSWNFDTTSTGRDGTYQFYSRAWDNANNYEDAPATNDTWTIVDTTPPTVDAGLDKNIEVGDAINFDGSGTQDNVDNLNKLNYTWNITKEGVLIISLYGVAPSYVFDDAGQYEVNLTVRDTAGNVGYDTMIVTVSTSTTPPSDFLSEYWWLLLIIAIVVISLILVLFIIMRKKKSESVPLPAQSEVLPPPPPPQGSP